MDSNRKQKRRHLLYYLRVFDANSGVQLGHLADITTAGLMLISDTPIHTDRLYPLRMYYPEPVNGAEYADFSAFCIWCRPDFNPRFYSSGFRIDSVAPEDARRIEALIEACGFND